MAKLLASTSKLISFESYCPDTRIDTHTPDQLLYLVHR